MGIPLLSLNDGNSVPMLAFGTGTAWFKKGDSPVSEDLITILGAAIKSGIRHIDAASAYGTEEEVGIAIQKSGVPREELFICSKVKDSPEEIADIHGALQTSLKKLQLDYVDLYLIHGPTFAKSSSDLQQAWKDMEAIKDSGKAKSIGVSNYMRSDIEATLETAKVVPAINQVEYQPYLQRANDYVPWLVGHGIHIEGFKPLAPITGGKGGPLDGPLEAIAEAHGVNVNAVLLRWQIQQGSVAVTTTKSEGRIEEYLKAVSFSLTAEEVEEISKIGLTHHYRASYQKRFAPDDRT